MSAAEVFVGPRAATRRGRREVPLPEGGGDAPAFPSTPRGHQRRVTLRRKAEESTRKTARGTSEATPVRALGGVITIVGGAAAVVIAIVFLIYLLA